jgi:acyl-CoA synthetase (AMP-forming)/AMP-acid ligase II
VQKVPEQVETVDVLPRNASGKILKYQLQEKYR